jgi:hypothetical protein
MTDPPVLPGFSNEQQEQFKTPECRSCRNYNSEMKTLKFAKGFDRM